MDEMKDPKTPIEAYKAIIDNLVQEARTSIQASMVSKAQLWPPTAVPSKFNPLVESLSSSNRELLSEMLLDERTGAVHDVLAELTWWILARGVKLTFQGKPMPVELSGAGLHGDFIGRLSDGEDKWEWPSGDGNEDE